ncbi:TetR/AcrR family transcriptional regulator [Jiangella anatolica]|uniref:TetR family transcriptional regulator n=1 Tax=Jiangella anatolica TaxID=2670374 RepID=A0A2W2B8I1_9ACTN|nr:TetR/AcrR family transcriptional regulator [Jiangella anatolica]PZF83811.1 TetR family transcriptional regulator [Jiangella anatolica]
MPTGIALGDARDRLFAAAERLLVSAGPGALTSRAVTDEAGVAKGVLHRHFADFDAFLAELVLDRIARVQARAAALRPGEGTVAGTLTTALTELFDPVGTAVVGLVIARDGLRARLRAAGSTGLPLMSEAAAGLAGYLVAERDLGRLPAGADVDALAATLIGAVHLQVAGADRAPADADAVRQVVATVLG